MALKTLQDLLVDTIKDIYDAEHQITKALPKMEKAASSSKLKEAFNQHLTQTEGQIKRLEEVFSILGEKPSRKTCKAMEGLVKEGDELLKEKAEAEVLDAGLIAAAQKVEHYEMASYGTARTYATMLGHNNAADLLQTTLDEEGSTDKKLTKIAETINRQAT